MEQAELDQQEAEADGAQARADAAHALPQGARRTCGTDGAPSARQLWPATREHGGAVLLRHVRENELEDLAERAIARRRPEPLPRNQANQAVLDGWVGMLAPHFDGEGAMNLTGTYADAYGYGHGCMLPRNVIKDFRTFIDQERPGVFLPWIIGVEAHNTGRDVLHFHAMVGGSWSEADMERLQARWTYSRGWAVAKPVTAAGGCVAYCAKHLLKRGADDTLEFRLVTPRRLSRHARRVEL